MFDFDRQLVVVTGAAGNLGRAVVGLFLEAGARVCAVDHRSGRIQEQLADQQFRGELNLFENVDLTDLKQTQSLSERIFEVQGVPDVLVNTVGGFTYGEAVHQISAETWNRMFDLNVQTLLNTAKAFVPSLVEEKRGRIVNVASRSGLRGSAQTGAYAAAKGVVIRLTESMAAELLPHRIRVNAVLPGIIDTPENRRDMPEADFSRWVTPEDVARTILFLSSDQSEAISGAAIPIYGRS